MRAAELAEARYAHDVAVALLTDAVASFDRIPRETATRASASTCSAGCSAPSPGRRGRRRPETRQRAVEFAESIHRDDLMIAAFTAWTEPTFWQARPYGVVDRPIVTRLSRLLARPDLSLTDRCQLLDAYTHELIGEADPTARAAAEEHSPSLPPSRSPAQGIRVAVVARDQNDLELPRRAQLSQSSPRSASSTTCPRTA